MGEQSSIWLHQTSTNISMAVLISDEKGLVLLTKSFLGLVQYATGYHPGPVVPPSADGTSFT